MKKFFVLGLIVLIVLLALLVIAYDGIDVDLSTKDAQRVNPGVEFLGEDLSDLTKEEVFTIVSKYQEDLYQEGEDAYLDPVTKGVIPGLPGKELDVENTVENIMLADSETTVPPQLSTIPPDKTIQDYQDAPIYQGNPKKDYAAFICNVAWGTEYIDELLNLLEEHQVRISFFLEGRWAANNPDKVEQIHEYGHEIGNHGYSHYMMSDLNRDKIREEIEKTNQEISEITGTKAELFGPPAGDFDEDVLRVASNLDMYTILWSLDTIDWKEPGVDYMTDKILNNIHPGAIILMHPTEDTVTALDEILTGLESKEYEVLPVSQLIKNYQ